LLKIMIALMATALLSLVIVFFVSRATLEQGFERFLERQEARQLRNLVPAAGRIYRMSGSWEAIAGNEALWNDLLDASGPPPGNRGHLPPPGARRPPPPTASGGRPGRPAEDRLPERDRLQFRSRLFLLDAQQRPVAGAQPQSLEMTLDTTLAPIEVAGEVVGYLGFESLSTSAIPEAGAFLSEQRRIARLSLIAALGVAALMAFALARHLARPIRDLAHTVRLLSGGDYGARIDVRTTDEIGRLAGDVNTLADTLESTERQRQQWMAEVAHELRTPLAILKGELEAVGDGVRRADEATLTSIRQEIDHLANLVDDLQLLALSDAGALRLDHRMIDFGDITSSAVESYRPRFEKQGLQLAAEVEDPVGLHGDASRLRQVIHNLLENSLRYTDAPGTVRLGLSADPGQVRLTIEDSGPGMSSEQIERLFERFFRAEESRNRRHGGSGLGLTICRRIVEAHGGRISAAASTLGGLSVKVVLPPGR
jgi:two-component system sensor histidine kinase BaeS